MLGFNYAIRSSDDGANRFAFLPGGHVASIVTAPGGATTVTPMLPADGWPTPNDESGDPYVDSQGRVGIQVRDQTSGGGHDILDQRYDRSMDDPEAVRDFGPALQAWPGQATVIYLLSTNTQLGSAGYEYPEFVLSGSSGAGDVDTGALSTWPWEQGGSGAPDYVNALLEYYLPGRAYEFAACSARDFSLVTRRVADVYNKTQPRFDTDGREFVGFWRDADGTTGRVRDISAADAAAIGQAAAFVPEGGAVYSQDSQSNSWNLMFPLAPDGPDGIAVMGVMEYDAHYVRGWTAQEVPYFVQARPGTYSGHLAIPTPVQVVLDPAYANDSTFSKGPIRVDETRSTWACCLMRIDKSGISNVRVLGRTTSASINVFTAGNAGQTGAQGYVMFGGGAPVFYCQYPGSRWQPFEYQGDGSNPIYYTSQNGWRVQILVPVQRLDDGSTAPSGYQSLLVYANHADGQAIAPEQPADWDDDANGPWQVPPNDIPYGQFGRGLPFDDGHGNVVYQDGTNSTYADYGYFAGVGVQNAYAPNGPYARSGAYGGYLRYGFFPIGLFSVNGQPFYPSHTFTQLWPGAYGQYGTVQPHCADDGARPAIRALQFPGRPEILYKLQLDTSGPGNGWRIGTGQPSGGVYSNYDWGEMNGTQVWSKRVVPPTPPPAQASSSTTSGS